MRKLAVIQAIITLCFLAMGAQTLVRLTTDVTGVLPVANGGTGAATAAAGTVFGNLTSSTAAPSFQTPTPASASAVPLPYLKRWDIIIADGAASANIGDTFTPTGTGSVGSATTTTPAFIARATSTTNGNVAGYLNFVVTTTSKFSVMTTFLQESTSLNRRDWVGFTDQSFATMGASDNPAGNYAAFWFCNDGANTACQKGGVSYDATNWWCVTKDGTTQELNDSGVAHDANYDLFTIKQSSVGVYDFYINGTKVCTNSVHPPTTATAIAKIFSTTCATCNPTTQKVSIGWIYGESSF